VRAQAAEWAPEWCLMGALSGSEWERRVRVPPCVGSLAEGGLAFHVKRVRSVGTSFASSFDTGWHPDPPTVSIGRRPTRNGMKLGGACDGDGHAHADHLTTCF
jgi:hypothetical protein